MLNIKTQEKIITHWKKLAEKNWEASKSLFRLGHYDMCLFCCHLALEKYLKALVTEKTRNNPPFIHDLNRLAAVAKLPLAEEHKYYLNEITKFNIQARYDDVKLAFYKKATKGFTRRYLGITEKLIVWIKKEFHRK